MALLFFRTMSLLRRIRHRASRAQLVRDVFSCYILAFLFVFLDLHFVGIKHYDPSLHRESLPSECGGTSGRLLGVRGSGAFHATPQRLVVEPRQTTRRFSDGEVSMFDRRERFSISFGNAVYLLVMYIN